MFRTAIWAREQSGGITLFWTEIGRIKNKHKLVSRSGGATPVTSWVPIAHSIPRRWIIMMYFQLCLVAENLYIYRVIIFSNRYLLWAQQLPPPSLHTLARTHNTDLYFPIKLLFPFLIRMFSEANPIVKAMYASIINTGCQPLIISWWITSGVFLLLTLKNWDFLSLLLMTSSSYLFNHLEFHIIRKCSLFFRFRGLICALYSDRRFFFSYSKVETVCTPRPHYSRIPWLMWGRNIRNVG